MRTVQAPVARFGLQAKLFRGLSDESRLTILEALRGGAVAVGEIATATGLTQPNVSNHLKCLSECGLVVGEQSGRFVYYRLGDKRVAQMLQLGDALLADVADRIRECANYRDAKSRSVDDALRSVPNQHRGHSDARSVRGLRRR